MVICPIQIQNKSSEELLVEKLRLQVDLLRIYQEEKFLWSSETRVSYRGGGQVSQVEALAGHPSDSKGAELLTMPLKSERKSAIGRTFGQIFDLTGIGIFSD
jgi:hypothetical protein